MRGVALFSAMRNNLSKVIDGIDCKIQEYRKVDEDISKRKASEAAMLDLLNRISEALFSYAKKTRNKNLRAKTNFSREKFGQMRLKEFVRAADVIVDEALLHLSDLRASGIRPGIVRGLQSQTRLRRASSGILKKRVSERDSMANSIM